MSFVHLHTHSHYSLLDGLPKIHDLVAKAKEFGCPALALTDHGVMYGALEFYQACKKAGVKPIIGMEAYMALGEKEEKRAGVDKDYHHLTLLARNEEGYRNLMMLTTIAHLEGFYYKPRIDKNLLRVHGKGLIALSGCLRGEISRALMAGKYEEAKRVAQEFQEIFGKENFFAEVQKHPELPEQEVVNEGMFRLCKELGLLPVATVDSHYLHADDAEAQDVLVCVQTGKFITDKGRLNMTGADLSFASPKRVEEQWADMPEAVANTLKVAELCNLELTLNKWAFPQFPTQGKTHDEYLQELTWQGAQEKFGAPPPQSSPIKGEEEKINSPPPVGGVRGGGVTDEIKKRIDYELDVIKKTGFSTYFLIVSDYVKWAREQGIVVTTRGSAAGSLVSYLIDITTINPLDFKLPFERFLTVTRPTPPDIDVDFADNRRDEVIDYVRQKYGADKVAQICTFGTMLPRAAVRDVTRVLGLPYSFGDKISKMIPPGAQGFHMTVDRALEENPDLGKLYNEDANVKRVLDLARKVEGCARHASVHAAGMVIAPTKLTDFTPLAREANGDNIITQYDMHAAEAAGLVKMDMLGIRNLSILGDAVSIVKKTKGMEIDIGKLPSHDAKTFEMLSRGDTMGVFQLAGSGMTRYLKELKPSSIHDIMAMVALFRPGPMESIPEYIRRKHNPRLVSYLDPRLATILERTYGILVYQDDVLLIAIELAGYSWEEADKLRKAMGKKIPREMIAQREKFLTGCVKGGLPRTKAEELWALIEPFAAYGFNKAHAASYGMVAYQTAYMKAHFPAEFITAILTAEAGNSDKVAEVIAGAREAGITVLPPDVNESGKDFTYVDDTHIRFGLLAIKNLGTDVVGAIIAERESNGLFVDLEDCLKRVQHKNLNKKSLESLVKSGAMDRFGDRAFMMESMEVMLTFNRGAAEMPTKQSSLFGALPQVRKLTLKDNVPPASKEEKLQWEKELLGLYVTSHPLYEFEEVLKGKVVATGALTELKDNTPLMLAGVLVDCKKRFTKNGEAMLTARLQDLAGSCELIVFPKAYKVSPELFTDGTLLCVWGKGGGEEKRVVCDRAMPLTHDNVAAGLQGAPLRKTEDRKQKTDPSSVIRPLSSGQRIFISLATQDKNILDTLRTFLSSTHGALPVFIVLEQNGQKRTIETSFCIDPLPAILQSLKSIVGKDAVSIVG
ncbi:DNA polymerase III subunit alpha [Candidatus Uhrbacteria bacterium RIFCSPLOWO2_01_FULL_47_24]|uniref:DNA-directed DNA polymerase n=1 Tax=Candidatus Uhrbacteria bacterium RIFCSPLOWO2_01_FULL_47_24 TaxID=1802401 RepID=A0A1F7UPC8_9BACT|nr:MAG: DNA polymerase III subunit alpha [Candidatus Uhrbacteria bacterium RIFCSPHIGHO2_01_FULL_47_11]OGL67945.1 MAG: DNA polymerase III subunit alpha [Candidatus Uhrbacteria bacterium RIFCSPHIGHO2_02_FULL_46_47]OGL76434.1 MAG: DNA polymerase III subunit alpha [Candidatus Uhrbacteria bacterium RIFCSPHIGHO2_12_FULL_47_11]OGL80131.1 MAG: DNA polymerase III subunit alpha [Candidatus Uhrbacteria bacterium RIFCSPLOWO2_01_FULL_47_24]OGL84916.1 MAG: DNA polymerase III subunit alpha [Candidatus Uhrbact